VRRAVAGEREAATELIATPIDLLSRWWWRVDVIGIERLPARGPVLVAANRAGALLPYEAFVLARSLSQASEGGTRVAHPVVDAWSPGGAACGRWSFPYRGRSGAPSAPPPPPPTRCAARSPAAMSPSPSPRVRIPSRSRSDDATASRRLDGPPCCAWPSSRRHRSSRLR